MLDMLLCYGFAATMIRAHAHRHVAAGSLAHARIDH